jgi:precorrin-6B methylase 2
MIRTWNLCRCIVSYIAMSVAIATASLLLEPAYSVPRPNSESIAQKNPPYVPSAETIVPEMLKLANVKANDIVYDLGSGDGRIVIAAVKNFGAQKGVGVEFNPELIEKSRENAQTANVSDRVQFIQRDLFETDVREATVVTLFLFPEVNLKLRPKLLNELKPGTRIVSQAFNMGDWRPDQTLVASRGDSKATLFLWIVPAQVGGIWRGQLTRGSGRSLPIALQLEQQYQQAKVRIQLENQTIELPGVKLVGEQVRFERRTMLEGEQMKLRFEGQVRGNQLTGILTRETSRSSDSYSLTARKTN